MNIFLLFPLKIMMIGLIDKKKEFIQNKNISYKSLYDIIPDFGYFFLEKGDVDFLTKYISEDRQFLKPPSFRRNEYKRRHEFCVILNYINVIEKYNEDELLFKSDKDFIDFFPQFTGLIDDISNKRFFANIIHIVHNLLYTTLSGTKKLCLVVAAKMTYGWRRKMVTGSGQTKDTSLHVRIYEEVTGIYPVCRKNYKPRLDGKEQYLIKKDIAKRASERRIQSRKVIEYIKENNIITRIRSNYPSCILKKDKTEKDDSEKDAAEKDNSEKDAAEKDDTEKDDTEKDDTGAYKFLRKERGRKMYNLLALQKIYKKQCDKIFPVKKRKSRYTKSRISKFSTNDLLIRDVYIISDGGSVEYTWYDDESLLNYDEMTPTSNDCMETF